MKESLKRNKTLSSDEKLLKWGHGEWVEELDYKQWQYKGIECEIFRNKMGSLCGYIHVPKGHPWHGKDYDDIETDVHGGLTYAYELKDGEFIIGFDCSHLDDFTPSLEGRRALETLNNSYAQLEEEFGDTDSMIKAYGRQTYKNISFVKAECESLVDQMLQEKSI